ncbi:hypothetical protein [Hoeflea prorocentri]|uniref:Alpha/beta hydrolase n=1 Tax=Hoeflea prorocentri TaxID=1922333 RepID=A0A9X3ZHL5_9HYPH|nr:hypothetical protein [Hoeflea prorocentri]MCY6381001.1 hypothetical protein [Hoeflea prorocentri]MDA5398801.1 hypothetical protein [Hoeflea prorocentri]
MTDIQQLLFGALLVAGVTLFVALITAPFEAMTWWSRWTSDPDGEPVEEDTETVSGLSKEKEAVLFYVTGIGTITGERHPQLEQGFIDALKRAMPNVTVIDDFFPYSPAGIPLTGQRIFARFWRFSGRHRAFVTQNLIRLRNMFQVLVAADGRYGPIYSAGTYRIMREKLLARGHGPHSGRPVIMLGYSGGAEISLGAAPFLHGEFESRLTLLSLGGVLSSHPGIAALDRIVHLQGSADRVARIGGTFFVHRWAIFGRSHWNQARKQGLISQVAMADMSHNGPGGYLDPDTHRSPEGPSNLERTIAEIKSVVEEEITLSRNGTAEA